MLLLGLKKLLDLESSKLYIITLSISLICSFYITFIVLLFIIFSSFLYLYIFKKENIKKAIFHLGVATIISILIASVILIPSFIQIFASQRASINLAEIVNSKFGPLSDKIAYLFGSTILIVFSLLILLNFKKHKKFTIFLFLNLLLLGLPLIIEPINKMWHFGSYVYFCYRYGFIIVLFLIIGAGYYLTNLDSMKKYPIIASKIIPLLLLIITFIVMFVIFYKYRFRIFLAIDSLTFTRDKIALLSLFIVSLLIFITVLILFFTNKKESNFTIIFLYIITISQILFNSYFYFNKYDSNYLNNQYNWMEEIYDINLLKDKYYVKETNRILISNYGMVSDIRTFSNFTSLVDKTNYETMIMLGYDSYGNDTEAIGGNLFTDIILAQKYIISDRKISDSYYHYVNDIDNYLYIYEFSNLPFGFVINNNSSIKNAKNSMEASNIIYNSITNNDNIFDIEKLDALENKYFISGKKRLYLDIDFNINNKRNNYNLFDIYVNGNLLYQSVPNTNRNGTLYLGEFLDEEVEIKIVSLKENNIKDINLGILDLQKIDDFLNNYGKNVDIEFNHNKMIISTNGNNNDLLFLPITYLDNYKCSTHEIFRVYDNFIGIKLHDGENIIEISFIPKGFIIGIIISFIGIVFFIIWERYLYKLNLTLLNNIFYYIYLVLFILLVSFYYIVLPILFIISFI